MSICLFGVTTFCLYKPIIFVSNLKVYTGCVHSQDLVRLGYITHSREISNFSNMHRRRMLFEWYDASDEVLGAFPCNPYLYYCAVLNVSKTLYFLFLPADLYFSFRYC